MARSIVSRGTEASRAFWYMVRSEALVSTSPPPSRAATSTWRINLAKTLARALSLAPLRCLVVAHFEWPDIKFLLPDWALLLYRNLKCVDKEPVNPLAVCQFRVERTAPDSFAANQHRVFAVAVVVKGENFKVLGPGFDLRRPDEHAGHFTDALHVDQRLETRDLPAVTVATYRQWQHVETPLVASTVEDFMGQQDQSGARAQDAQPVFDLLLQRRANVGRRQQIGDRGGLPTGYHQAVQVVELFDTAHGHDVRADAFEHGGVFAHIALKGEDANARHVY